MQVLMRNAEFSEFHIAQLGDAKLPRIRGQSFYNRMSRLGFTQPYTPGFPTLYVLW